MALTSFKLRRTDDVGSYVRETGRLDSAIRSDDFIQPSSGTGPIVFQVVPFNVEQVVVNGLEKHKSTVRINWSIDEALQTNPASTAPVELHITVNQYGEPLTVEDGTKVVVYNQTNYVETYDHESLLYKPGTWLYYGLFLKYSDGTSESTIKPIT